MTAAPKLIDHLDKNCRQYLMQVHEALNSIGITARIDTTIVRGLDYYTGVVFEFKTTRLGAQDAIAAGGRYNDLVRELGGPSIPAIGFALGVDRLMSLLNNETSLVSEQRIKLFIAAVGAEATHAGFKLAQDIRADGWQAEQDFLNRSLKNQLSYAAEKEYPFVVIIGEEELEKHVYTLKDMNHKTQSHIPQDKQKIIDVMRSGNG
jgi:histidyl-tRNA synthetase